jgi:transposase InsO family protein
VQTSGSDSQETWPSRDHDVASAGDGTQLPETVRDAEIVAVMQASGPAELSRRFGARKMWLHVRSRGHEVARCTIERLYAVQGWAGALRAKKYRTTIRQRDRASSAARCSGTGTRHHREGPGGANGRW